MAAILRFSGKIGTRGIIYAAADGDAMAAG